MGVDNKITGKKYNFTVFEDLPIKALASDLASFNNLSEKDLIRVLQSGVESFFKQFV